MDNPTLDDVLDWFALERQEGVIFLTGWQLRYPQYATELAEFDAFLYIAAIADPLTSQPS